MTLDPGYLHYPLRRYGMDHDLYDWSMLRQRPAVAWPGGAKVALLIVPVLEWFPLDMANRPFAPPGAMSTAYPDLRHYTLRDYGNRVGIFRILDELVGRGLKATAAINAAVALRYPALIGAIGRAGWEVMAHGRDMAHLHYGGMDREAERDLIETTLDQLEWATGQRPRGWMSPAKSQSWATPALLQAAGLTYCCDWDNDDLPYRMTAGTGDLVALPLSPDSEDQAIVIRDHHSEDAFAQELCDQFDLLHAEAARTGSARVMSITLHPWVTGQPYRIGALAAALDHILACSDVWSASGTEIVAAWQAQVPPG